MRLILLSLVNIVCRGNADDDDDMMNSLKTNYLHIAPISENNWASKGGRESKEFVCGYVTFSHFPFYLVVEYNRDL